MGFSPLKCRCKLWGHEFRRHKRVHVSLSVARGARSPKERSGVRPFNAHHSQRVPVSLINLATTTPWLTPLGRELKGTTKGQNRLAFFRTFPENSTLFILVQSVSPKAFS